MKPLFTILLCSICLLVKAQTNVLTAANAPAVITLTWIAPPDYQPNYYLVAKTTAIGIPELWVANSTNSTYPVCKLNTGLNYFAVRAVLLDSNGVPQISGWSNWAVVADTAALGLQSWGVITNVIEGETDLGGQWQVMTNLTTVGQTNILVVPLASPSQFFRSQMNVFPVFQEFGTNIVTFPTNAPPAP